MKTQRKLGMMIAMGFVLTALPGCGTYRRTTVIHGRPAPRCEPAPCPPPRRNARVVVVERPVPCPLPPKVVVVRRPAPPACPPAAKVMAKKETHRPGRNSTWKYENKEGAGGGRN